MNKEKPQVDTKQWIWMFTNDRKSLRGHVGGIDSWDALSHLMTSPGSDGKLFGDKYNIPVDILQESTGNDSPSLEIDRDGFRIELSVVTCPKTLRHEGDIPGCGSTKVSRPDDEGWVDCGDCGLMFNPLTCDEPVKTWVDLG